jgi:hypothetical protein
MARLDKDQLVRTATGNVNRVLAVQQDPAVRKAWKQAGMQVAAAGVSLRDAVGETRAAWDRAGGDVVDADATLRAA